MSLVGGRGEIRRAHRDVRPAASELAGAGYARAGGFPPPAGEATTDPTTLTARGEGLVGKRNEFRLARHLPDPLLPPRYLRRLDLLARARHEVPPDEARAVERCAAEQ